MAKFKYYNGSSWIELLANEGASPNLNDGTTVTQPQGANALSIKTIGATSDTGIFYLSEDASYVCNSGDSGYVFAVFDKDVTQDFSTSNNAAFAIYQSSSGAIMKGDLTVGGSITSGGYTVATQSWVTNQQYITSSGSCAYANSAGSAPANGGNADTVDGYHASESADSSTLVARTSNGYVYATYYNCSNGAENPSSFSNNTFLFADGSGWIRKASAADFRTAIGAGTSNFTGYTSSNKLDGAYIDNTQQWTSNAGTVTSVQVQAGTGLTSSTSTSQNVSLNTTISIDSNYKLPTTSEWAGKQATLVSGTNIKTINGESILGSGDISISGGSGSMTAASTSAIGAMKVGAVNNVVSYANVVSTSSLSNYDKYSVQLDKNNLGFVALPRYQCYIYIHSITLISSNGRVYFDIVGDENNYEHYILDDDNFYGLGYILYNKGFTGDSPLTKIKTATGLYNSYPVVGVFGNNGGEIYVVYIQNGSLDVVRFDNLSEAEIYDNLQYLKLEYNY